MSFIFEPIMALMSGIGAAGAGAAGAGAVEAGTGLVASGAGAAGAGIAGTIGSILEGTAGVLGLVSSIASGQADKEAADLAAIDAEREKPLENLQGIERRRSLKAAAAEAIGAQDVAYAASGVDLSFGTARQARSDAFRELDLGLTSDVGTQQTRVSRLTERAANYRRLGKRALSAGWVRGLGGALGTGAKIAERY